MSRIVRTSFLFAVGILSSLVGCDSIEPVNDDILVVEGFIDAGKPLPSVTLIRAQPLDAAPAINAVRDASLNLTIDGHAVTYTPSATEPGKYAPAIESGFEVPPRAHFRVDIYWRDQQISTEDIVPPPIRVDSIRVNVPDSPVAAILVDTLRLDNPQVGARKGYIYPIDVQLWWSTPFDETGVDSLYWVETRIRPQIDFSSKVLDVFLRTEEVQREYTMPKDGQGRRVWKGVYAVPVPDAQAPVPDHKARVQLVRGSEAYGRYAASRNAPERREPVSNLNGAIGILAGISLDTYTFEINSGRQVPVQP